jgi:hypothetical protein
VHLTVGFCFLSAAREVSLLVTCRANMEQQINGFGAQFEVIYIVLRGWWRSIVFLPQVTVVDQLPPCRFAANLRAVT